MNPADLLLYFENPVGRLLEHPDGFAVVEYAPGARQLADFTAFLTHVGELLRRRNWNRIYGDQRRMTRFTPQETEWIKHHWLTPGSDRPADLYTAVILPRDAFASLAVSQVMSEAQVSVLTYRFFDEDEEYAAERWLRQRPARR